MDSNLGQEYLDLMVGFAVECGLLVDKSYPTVPEIRIKYPENIRLILNSKYMEKISTEDIDEGVNAAMRFALSCGIIMADIWNRDFSHFHNHKFKIDDTEIARAIELMGNKTKLEELCKKVMNGFYYFLTREDEPSIPSHLTLLLMTMHLIGTGIFLRKCGFK